MRIDPDHYKQRVYDWEHTSLPEIYKCTLRQEQTEALVEKIWLTTGHNVPPQTKHLRTGARRAYSSALEKLVAFPEWGRNPICICHEMAHQIIQDRQRRDKSFSPMPHGSEWLWTYMQLLVKFCGKDLASLRGSAVKAVLPTISLEAAAAKRLLRLV